MGKNKGEQEIKLYQENTAIFNLIIRESITENITLLNEQQRVLQILDSLLSGGNSKDKNPKGGLCFRF